MTLNNKVYDCLKWIATYLLPAFGTLYFALSQIWGTPYGEEIVGTITAIDAFIGAILGISSSGFQGDGILAIDRSNPEKDLYSLEIATPLEDLPRMKSVTLKIDPFATISNSQENHTV